MINSYEGCLRVIAVTTFFPNSANPQRTVFVKNLLEAMRTRCDVRVIAPVPYVPPFIARPRWRAQRAIPASEIIGGIDVYHPRFAVLPKLGWLSGITYALSIFRQLRKLSCDRNGLIVHVHCAYPDAVGVAFAAWLLRLPYVVTAHGSDINVYAEQPVLAFQIRWALRRSAGVVAVSRMLAEKIKRLIGTDETKKIVCIPCAAVAPTVFFVRPKSAVREALALESASRIVVFAGELRPVKGIEFLIAAWSELRKQQVVTDQDCLILVGDGPCKAALMEQIARAGGDRTIRFVGSIAQVELANWISAATLFCLPSGNEGTPNVIIEALASGIPVVASRVGGIPDLIQDGQNGLLVPPMDTPALAVALASALARTWDSEAIAASVADRTWRVIADRNYNFLQTWVDKYGAVN